MSLGSLPLVALVAIFFFLVPVSIWKATYDWSFPLHKHSLPLSREILNFHFPYFLFAFLPAVGIFLHCGAKPAHQLIAVMFFPTLNGPGTPALSSSLLDELVSWVNLGFIALVYIFSAVGGYIVGLIRWRKLRSALIAKRALYLTDKTGLIGFWGALMPRNSNDAKVTLDILTNQQVLYSGELFYYNLEDGCLDSIALRKVQRFLTTTLQDVNGEPKNKEKREKRYDIPGEVTFFLGSNIANINIREIIEQRKGTSVISENVQNVTTKEFENDLKELLKGAIKEQFEKEKKDSALDKKQKTHLKTPKNKKKTQQ